jgi:hypothetical protein
MLSMPVAFARSLRLAPGLHRRLSMAALALLGACSFDPSPLAPGPGNPGDGAPSPGDAGAPGDADPSAPDADDRPSIPRDVAHVPENAWLASDRDVVWSDDVTIDTSSLTITGPGAAGTPDLTFVSSPHAPHDPPGPELALLYLADWTVEQDVTVRVTGSRPLVVISSGDIELRGVIDAGARRVVSGPGGFAAGLGPGAGQLGVHLPDFLDPGGGGAGHATQGARGGQGCAADCTTGTVAPGGPGGASYGDAVVSVLTGGSGGGQGGSGGADACAPGGGGAGGGAVQLYATGRITVTASGGISVGGGGGGGGFAIGCSDSGGGGGGSGGVVYLQAERIDLAGVLAANGGGGGSDGGSINGDGVPGADGALDADPAPGGIPPDGESVGGAGGAGTAAPGSGSDVAAELNGGGGGGAAGRVVLHCSGFSGDGLVSPAPHRTAGCALP